MSDENVEENCTKKIKLEGDLTSCESTKGSSTPCESSLSEQIARQLDYYFSDVNVIKDKFLLQEFKKEDGWVKLSVLLTFSRLKELTKDEDRLVQALKECKSQVVELNEEKKQIRRKNPVPDAAEYQKQLDLRTVHISGFPTDYNFETLQKFCRQYGEIESLAMRRHFKTRFFKGCVHVVYTKEEDAKKVLEIETLKCKDRELQKESMEGYHKRKAEMAQKRSEIRKKKKDSISV